MMGEKVKRTPSLKEMRKKWADRAPDDVARYVAQNFVMPRSGPWYVRCSTCRAQIFLNTLRGLRVSQDLVVDTAIRFLAVRLKQHMLQHREGE